MKSLFDRTICLCSALRSLQQGAASADDAGPTFACRPLAAMRDSRR